MARCRKCGLSFDPQPGSQGMYCSRDCTNAAKRGKAGGCGKFENLGLGPRLSLIKMSGPGTWERDNIKDIIPAGDLL